MTGQPVYLLVQRVGEEPEEAKITDSNLSDLPLTYKEHHFVNFKVYGVKRISNDIAANNYEGLTHLFSQLELAGLQDVTGTIDVLIGLGYNIYHPRLIARRQNLVIASNCFGKCLSGHHHGIQRDTETVIAKVVAHHLTGQSIEESLGRVYNPKWKCNMESSNLPLKEESEMKLIEQGLYFKGDHWEACYPCQRDPCDLPNNRPNKQPLQF